jgi:hypothetical protein
MRNNAQDYFGLYCALLRTQVTKAFKRRKMGEINYKWILIDTLLDKSGYLPLIDMPTWR